MKADERKVNVIGLGFWRVWKSQFGFWKESVCVKCELSCFGIKMESVWESNLIEFATLINELVEFEDVLVENNIVPESLVDWMERENRLDDVDALAKTGMEKALEDIDIDDLVGDIQVKDVLEDLLKDGDGVYFGKKLSGEMVKEWNVEVVEMPEAEDDYMSDAETIIMDDYINIDFSAENSPPDDIQAIPGACDLLTENSSPVIQAVPEVRFRFRDKWPTTQAIAEATARAISTGKLEIPRDPMVDHTYAKETLPQINQGGKILRCVMREAVGAGQRQVALLREIQPGVEVEVGRWNIE